MQVITHELEYRRPDVFSFRGIGDTHCGASECVEHDLIHEIQRRVMPDPHSYIFQMGDAADCITKNDKRFDSEQIAKWVEKKVGIIESERQHVAGIYKDPAEDGRILAWHIGNHELTIYNLYGENLGLIWAKALKVPYAGYAAFTRIIFKRHNSSERHEYLFHTWHGAGAAQSDGAVENRLLALVNAFEADVYLMGHLHKLKVIRPERIALRNGKVKSVPVVAACTGSWLRGYPQGTETKPLTPTYIETHGYKPTALGCPVIQIRPDTGEMWGET